MASLNRRQFFLTTAAGSLAAAWLSQTRLHGAETEKRKMTLCLSCGRIGVRADDRKSVELAAQHGFESIDPRGQVAGLSDGDLKGLVDFMESKGVTFGAAGLPVDFRGTEEKFASGMANFADFAAGLQRAGVTRIGTWLRPSHDSLTYLQNFRQHARRLRLIAEVLAGYGIRFGLEYVGPKTSWTSGRFAFIHTMAETKELIAEIGQANVGFVLDSWHWYTAGETAEDLMTLTNDDIVAVDLNDAPANIPRDEQVDSRRELPCATGVIDVAAFLNCLNKIGYDGPVRAEPFNAALRAMPEREAVTATARAMKQAFSLIR